VFIKIFVRLTFYLKRKAFMVNSQSTIFHGKQEGGRGIKRERKAGLID
jgi:hypothetical protein